MVVVAVAVFSAATIAEDVGFGIATLVVLFGIIGLIVPLLFIGDEERRLPGGGARRS